MRTMFHILLGLSALLMSVITHAGEAGNLLERMEKAAEQLNYEGVFSYQAGKHQQSIRIIHQAEQQGEIERLISLNGVTREVIRHNDMMTCIYPEGKSVQPKHRPLGGGFPIDFLHRVSTALPHYKLSLGKEQRIAGLYTRELIVNPIDNYRYGYRLWVDKDSDLLLQSDLVNEQGQALETFAFSSVEIGHTIPEQLLHPELKGNEMTWNRAEQRARAKKTVTVADSLWQVKWVPEGFELVTQQNRFKARNGAAIEQRVYSDGLNSFSIFIEKIRAQHSHLRGGSKRGAVNAFGTIINTYIVTVVGEVPARTVEKVGSAISYLED